VVAKCGRDLEGAGVRTSSHTPDPGGRVLQAPWLARVEAGIRPIATRPLLRGRPGQGEECRLELGRPRVRVGGGQAGRGRGDPHRGVARSPTPVAVGRGSGSASASSSKRA
jgi:hypothetical protein